MGHNVWSHINAVQEANRQYDNGITPAMLVEERFDRLFFRDVVEAIFATDKRDEAEAIIEEFSRFWMSIIGTRGATGKRTVNASTQFNALFEVDESTSDNEHEDGSFSEEEEHKLEEMENEQL